MMRPRSIRRKISLRTQLRRGVPLVLTSRSRRNLVYHFVGIQPNKGVGREGMSGAIIGMHMHNKTSTTAQRGGGGGGVYSYSMDTIEGPRAPAVKLTARHSSLTRVRAAPLSPW